MAERVRLSRAKKEWHLICETRLGKVSMLRDLTLYEAREAYKRLKPDGCPKEHVFSDCKCGEDGWCWSGGWGRSYGPTDDWLEKVSVIGPNGAGRKELDPWSGVQPHIIDMTHLCRCGHGKPKEAPWDESRSDFWNNPKLWEGIDPTKQMCWSKRRANDPGNLPLCHDDDLPEHGNDRPKRRQRVSANLRHAKAPKGAANLSGNDRPQFSGELIACQRGEAA